MSRKTIEISFVLSCIQCVLLLALGTGLYLLYKDNLHMRKDITEMKSKLITADNIVENMKTDIDKISLIPFDKIDVINYKLSDLEFALESIEKQLAKK